LESSLEFDSGGLLFSISACFRCQYALRYTSPLSGVSENHFGGPSCGSFAWAHCVAADSVERRSHRWFPISNGRACSGLPRDCIFYCHGRAVERARAVPAAFGSLFGLAGRARSMSERRLEAVVIGPGRPGLVRVALGRGNRQFVVDAPLAARRRMRIPQAPGAQQSGSVARDNQQDEVKTYGRAETALPHFYFCPVSNRRVRMNSAETMAVYDLLLRIP
jgi:hypothetical protein